MKIAWNSAGHPPRNAAYTLVEILIASAVVALMSVSLFAGFSLGFLVIRTSRENLRATQILTEKIEGLRLCTWSELSNCPTSFTDQYQDGTTNSSGTTYRGTISMSVPTFLPEAYQQDVKLITVAVTWTNYLGNTRFVHTRKMQTESAYAGMQNYIWGTHQ